MQIDPVDLSRDPAAYLSYYAATLYLYGGLAVVVVIGLVVEKWRKYRHAKSE